MKRRIALIAAIAAGTVALVPASAGAKSNPLCFKYQKGQLQIQVGYCP
jgi:hypothetical protein